MLLDEMFSGAIARAGIILDPPVGERPMCSSPSCHGKPERYAKPGSLTGAAGLCPTSGCGHHESVANDEVKAYLWS